jgi:PAS domain S-box-containing protein
VSSQDSADRVRESALQTASSILSLQRRVDEEIRALNKALQQRSEELATANIELQRQTETAHAQARDVEVFRIAFDSSGSGMLLVSPDLRISRVNAAFSEFIGHPMDALYTRSIADFMLPADLEVTRRGVLLLLRGDVATLHLEYPHKHASGRPVWGSVTSAVVRDTDGTPLYLIVQIQDISGRIQAEAEKRQLEAQLLQAQKMEALGTLSRAASPTTSTTSSPRSSATPSSCRSGSWATYRPARPRRRSRTRPRVAPSWSARSSPLADAANGG